MTEGEGALLRAHTPADTRPLSICTFLSLFIIELRATCELPERMSTDAEHASRWSSRKRSVMLC